MGTVGLVISCIKRRSSPGYISPRETIGQSINLLHKPTNNTTPKNNTKRVSTSKSQDQPTKKQNAWTPIHIPATELMTVHEVGSSKENKI